MARHTVADMRAVHAAGGHFAAATAWDRPTAEFAEAAQWYREAAAAGHAGAAAALERVQDAEL